MNLTTRKEKITFGEEKLFGIFKRDIKFTIVADIPDTMLDAYAEIAKTNDLETDPKEQKKAFELMRNVIISMLSPYNNKRKVEKFVGKLGMRGVNKIFLFLNNYVNEVDEEKKNEKSVLLK